MGRSIEMLHPGPVRLVRRGARKDAVAVVPVRTRVEIREIDPRDIPKVASPNRDGTYRDYHAHGGRLWLCPKGDRVGNLPVACDPDTFVAFLEGRLPAASYARSDYVRALAGTPVLGPLVREVRSEDPDALANARAVIDDARDEASRVARRWAEDRILLAGGKVYLRAPSPMAILGSRDAYADLGRVAVDPFPSYWRTCRYQGPQVPELAMELNGYPVRLDRVKDIQVAVEPYGLIADPAHQMSVVPVQAGGIPRELLADDDLVLMANVLPGRLLRELGRLRREGVPVPDAGGGEAALRTLEVRGTAGLIDIEDAEAAIARVAAVARGLPGARCEAMALWADAVALPRLRDRDAPEPPDEDRDALASLQW